MRNNLDAPEVQAVGPLQLDGKLALYVKKGGQDSRDGLAVNRHEAFRGGHFVTHGRFGFAQNVMFKGGVFEGPGTGQAARPAAVYGLFDGANLPLSHQREMRQTIFDRPLIGPGTPVELGLAESGSQFFCLTCNLFELLAILFEFQEHYLELYFPGNSPPVRNV